MSKQETIAYLSSLSFFDSLDPEFIDFLADCAERRELDADQVLFRFHSPAKSFFVLVEGSIIVEVAAIQGPPLQLQEVGPGAVLGWSWLISPYQWSFQGRAELASVVYEFDGPRILKRCETDNGFGYSVLKLFSALMSERLEAARQRMQEEWSPAGFA